MEVPAKKSRSRAAPKQVPETSVEPVEEPKSRSRAAHKKAPETNVVGAFGGIVAPPAIFVEEVEASVPSKVKGSKKATKPQVVASVTPDGIMGSLGEQRPLIAHLPIHSSDIDNDLFAAEPMPIAEGAQPRPFDPDDTLIQFQDKQAAPTYTTPLQPEVQRPSLPLHYSEKLMIRFQDANRVQQLPESTDVACFWDAHPFRGRPCIIPVVIEEDIWRVYGNFCCPECAAAYLFSERLDSHVKWERYALLNRLYAEGADPVRLAPGRAVLRLFGGSIDVVDYRAALAEKRMRVDVMTPPMISIIQVMDTKPIDFYDASIKNTFIPWEMDRMNRPGAQGLRLRRTKPIAEKESTLEWCMGITS
jgi:hypothetical protein